ncbi:MAG: ECF transporter S component [Raoultibacter sp.]
MKRALAFLEIPVLLAVPAVLAACAMFQFDQTALLSLGVVAAALVVFFAHFEASRPALRQIMPTVVLAALAAAGRILFAPIPSFKPVAAICILAGVVFGRRSGFMVGALAALVSNFFFGQGPWTPWQMYAWGLVGYGAGVLADTGCFQRHPSTLYAYGFASALFYGLILNSWFIIGFVHPLTWPAALLAYGAGLPFDCIQGAATLVFLCALYAPWKKKLERIKQKYAITEAEETLRPQRESDDHGA